MATEPLTVGTLIEFLQDYDLDTRIVVSSDPEGNRYSYLAGAYETSYCFENEVTGLGNPVADEDVDYYREDDPDFELDSLSVVICLWPWL